MTEMRVNSFWVDRMDGSWKLLYTQFKNPAGDEVLCLMHKETRKFMYFDVKLNRVLTKQEAMSFRVDGTGWNRPYQERQPR